MNQKKDMDSDHESADEQDDALPPKKAAPAPAEDSDEPMDADDDDEVGGRADLGRYAGGQSQAKLVQPGATEESPESSQIVADSHAGQSKALMSRSGGFSGSLAGKDAYFCELQGFVDGTLKSVANKIAEKKSVELDNSSTKVILAKLRDDAKKEEKTQKELERSIIQESETTQKREAEAAKLRDLLETLKAKVEERRAENEARLAELENCCNQNKQELEESREKFQSIKEQLDSDRAATRDETRRLTSEHSEACDMLEAMKKRASQMRLVEGERTKMLREKSRILASLIAQETASGKSSVQMDICKILKTPEKNSFAMSRSFAERANA